MSALKLVLAFSLLSLCIKPSVTTVQNLDQQLTRFQNDFRTQIFSKDPNKVGQGEDWIGVLLNQYGLTESGVCQLFMDQKGDLIDPSQVSLYRSAVKNSIIAIAGFSAMVGTQIRDDSDTRFVSNVRAALDGLSQSFIGIREEIAEIEEKNVIEAQRRREAAARYAQMSVLEKIKHTGKKVFRPR